MSAVSAILSGVSMAASIAEGAYANRAARDAADSAEQQASLARSEAQADASRYASQAQSFKASQAVAYLKSGVALEGSPLDVLDETARVASENLSAITAKGDARASEYLTRASELRSQGRQALIGGYLGALNTGMGAFGRTGGSGSATETVTPSQSSERGASVPYSSGRYGSISRLSLTGF